MSKQFFYKILLQFAQNASIPSKDDSILLTLALTHNLTVGELASDCLLLNCVKGYFHIIGGWNSVCYDHHYRISPTGDAWEAMRPYPLKIVHHVGVVDGMTGRIYVFGGHSCSTYRAHAYYYKVETDNWVRIEDLPWTSVNTAASIIKQKDGSRWIVLASPKGRLNKYFELG